MPRIDTEILIVGGGIAGLVATAAFAHAGFQTLCVDSESPAAKPDQRSTAFLMPSVALLERADLWHRLQPFAAPLKIMRIIDADPDTQTIRESADFDAADINRAQFGFNLPNAVLRSEIAAHLGLLSSARLEAAASFEHLTSRTDNALVRLRDGRTIQAKLVIAADGRKSAVRDQLGIAVRTWRYGQRAIVFAVTHPMPHQNISTEVHHAGGPFTLVPLADPYQSAVVWMERADKAAFLMALSDAEFAQAASIRCCHVLGPLSLCSPRAIWPIVAQLASRLNAPRTALVAEAAHVVPPVGAQGLNMSLSDIAVLLDLVTDARASGEDIASAELLARYNRQRLPVITARVTGIDVLNRAAMTSSPLLRDLRRAGLSALFNIQPLRKAAMRLGLG